MPTTPALGPDRVFGRGMSFPPRVQTDGRIAWSTGEAPSDRNRDRAGAAAVGAAHPRGVG